MRCEKTRGRLPALLNHSLSIDERDEVTTHLKQCEACSDELIRLSYQVDEDAPCDDQFVQAVMEGLPLRAPWQRSSAKRKLLVPGLVAGLMVAVSLWMVWLSPLSLAMGGIGRYGSILAMTGFLREFAPGWLVPLLVSVPLFSGAVLLRIQINEQKG